MFWPLAFGGELINQVGSIGQLLRKIRRQSSSKTKFDNDTVNRRKIRVNKTLWHEQVCVLVVEEE